MAKAHDPITPGEILLTEFLEPLGISQDRLAQATRPHAALPPQWADGLPDYGHPPLWFWWMGLSLRVFGPNHFAVHGANFYGNTPLSASITRR